MIRIPVRSRRGVRQILDTAHLVTGNQRDFAKVPGLLFEDWTR
jgi:hypothetical protein